MLASSAIGTSLPAIVVARHLPEWAMFRADYCYVLLAALTRYLRIVIPFTVGSLCLLNELFSSEWGFSSTLLATALLVDVASRCLQERAMIGANDCDLCFLVYI